MAKFSGASQTRAKSRTSRGSAAVVITNKAGGQAFKQSDKLELVNILLSSMLGGDMYRSGDGTLQRLKALVKTVDPEFAAKAALYARNEFGMRSTSQVIAGELAVLNKTSGTAWGRDFYNAVTYRVDDMMEIMGYYLSACVDKPLPNAMKAGFAEAFKRFDAYQLAKYKGDTRAVKLVDVVRLVRPKPSEKNADALKALLEGTLKNTQTWESKISAAGQTQDVTEKAEAREQAWGDLLRENKLGYLALIRNLVNISNDVKDQATFDLMIQAVENEESIKKSMVFPFQMYTAYKMVEGKIRDTRRAGKVMDALSKAVDIACANVPKMDGDTLVAIDISGSMSSNITAFNSTSAVELAALFGSVLAKANEADVMLFDDSAKYVVVPKTRSVLDSTKALGHTHGGTSFESIFRTANKAYNRIFILSDMQSWVNGNSGLKSLFNSYKSKYSCNPYLYSFDLKGHGDMQFPENDGKVIAMAGFSEKVFDLIAMAETDRNAMIHTIENYKIQVMRKKK